jgi:hypothetical protein
MKGEAVSDATDAAAFVEMVLFLLLLGLFMMAI